MKNSGFSLIELVIATGIFAMVLVMAIGSYTSFSRLARQTQYQREVSEAIQLIYNAIGSQVWNASEIESVTATEARLKLRDGGEAILKFANNKITLNDKKLVPDDIKLYPVGGKIFAGADFLKTSFLIKVYNNKRLIKEYTDPISFIHTLRI